MYLKALEIQGFKSFPERTLIEFHEGITAIVGPNGSGKSNIADAIRWVLGEQSVRTLRGGKMEDVIFSGTETRRAMGFAEVSIIIDNSDGKMPVEYSEIQVTRRLYRSGESEYSLNRTNCRLRDIVQLFMDTGIGRDGYSIVGQGRVDEVLSNKAEDRRRVFEEASGIVKFKARKEEAERKLLATEQNLIRISDLAAELEQRLEPLAQQAEAATIWKDLSSRLREIEVALILDTVAQQLMRQREALQEKETLERDLAVNRQDLQNLRNQNQQMGEEMAALERQTQEQHLQVARIGEQSGEARGQAALLAERATRLDQRLEEVSLEISEIADRLIHLADDQKIRAEKREQLTRQETIYAERLNNSESAMAEILSQLSQREHMAEEAKNQLADLQEQLFLQREENATAQGQVQALEQQTQLLGEEIQAAIRDIDRNRLLMEEVEAQNRQAKAQRAALEQQRDKTRALLEQSRTQTDRLSADLSQHRQAEHDAQYRLETLQDLERRHEGYGEAVRHALVFAASQPHLSRQVQGTVASLIRVRQEHELAIETALGWGQQNIVVADEQTASDLITELKDKKAGRATFLPLATIERRQIDPALRKRLAALDGYLATGDELAEYQPEIQPAIQFLLGRTVVARDLAAARRLATACGHSLRIVSLEGDVMNPGGSMTGGYQRQGGAGLLSRRRELEELTVRLAKISEMSVQIAQRLKEAEKALQEAGQKLAAEEQKLLDQTHACIHLDARQNALQNDLDRAGATRKSLEQEQQLLQQQLSDITRKRTAITQAIAAGEETAGNLRSQINQLEQGSQEERDRRDDLREQITEWRVSLQSIQDSIAAADETLNRLDEDAAGRRLKKKALEQEVLQGQQERQTLIEQRQATQTQIEDLQKQGITVAEHIRKLDQTKRDLETRQSGFFSELERATDRLAEMQAEIGRVDGRIQRFEAAADEARNRLWEDYELTAAQAEGWPALSVSRTEAARQVQQLKNDIRALGTVNLFAIEESLAVQERFAFVDGQRRDILDARDKLNGVISELTVAMREQFIAQFQLINENFRQVFAELFGGGMADLRLEEEQDALTGGIEIRAQPPGKKLQNLMLLSGGERCLTAIALLFAILKLRPSPFCVLDEVEAALDDTNVLRFNEYIRHYANESQFIVVTHRKETMEAADRLYGVTMQERGVSRILSMLISDGPQDLARRLEDL